ncbi:hypothetical protein [Paenibacillus thermotolerans]|uniref:hypothetical protein n=1 Tax=Paenibacillus thermotolerans TaxID=3027807 RepID=UPI002368D3E2|nr:MULTISPECIES: hypothetical protein [unclassified Paenibacillus]
MKTVMYLIAVAAIFLVLFFVYKMRYKISSQQDTKSNGSTNELHALTFDATPDQPQPFGYKCQWIAIKTENTQEIVEYFNLSNTQFANWSTGIKGAYEGFYFISPPMNGWTLVMSSKMPDLSDTTNRSPIEQIVRLSEYYGEAYYFGTHRVVEYHAWAKAVEGQLVRAYGYLGERAEMLIDKGELTSEEIEHHLVFTPIEDDESLLPDEEHVLLIAKEWSVDPLMEYENLECGVGVIGRQHN